MGLTDLFKKKWKHSNAEVRAAAVRELGPEDGTVLEKIAQTDKDAGVRRIAIKKLDDPEILTLIARADDDESLRQIAAEKATGILVSTAVADDDEERSLRALGQLEDQRPLAEVAKTANLKSVRQAAVERLTDEKALADVARNAQEPQVRLEALKQVKDIAVLRGVALNDERKEVCLGALELMDEPAALEAVARKAKNKTVRAQARKRLEALGAGKPKAGKKKQSKWLQLCEMVEVLCRSSDWERTGQKIEEAQREWAEMEGERSPELQERFKQAVDQFFERFAAHKEKQEERAREERRLQQLLSGRMALCEEAEALEDPAGIEELQARWDALDPIPAAHREVIEQRFAKACEACVTRRQRRIEGQERRERFDELLGEAEQLRGSKQAGRKLKEIRAQWDALRPTAEEGELTERLEAIEHVLEQEREQVRERRRQDRRENQERLESLCQRLEKATETDNLKSGERLLKEAQSALKRTGDLPSGADREALSKRLQAARETLFARVQELREADEWKRWSVVPKLEELCARIEGLAEEQNLKRVSQELRKAQAAWKKVGPAPRDKSGALWKRFKSACDKAYARCQEYFAQAEQERDANLKKKLELCDEVEQLADRELSDKPGFEQTATQIKDLQARWKKIGPVPKAQSDAIWARFRKACDRFFDRRQEFLDQASGERDENLKKKEALCEEAEQLADGELADSDAIEETAGKVKELQARWKKIGPVPRAQSDAVWSRFRAACDRFFDRRQQFLDAERLENKARKEALCERLETLLATPDADPTEVGRQVLEVRGEWKGIGPAPQADADVVWGRFRDGCERAVEAFPAVFQGTELDPDANRKKKERLCQRAEELARSVTPVSQSSASAGSVEEMAEQLRSALAANTFRDGDAEEQDIQSVIREAKRLQGQWRKIGPIPGEAGQELWDRFKGACDRVFELRPGRAEKGKGEAPEEGDGRQQQNLEQKQALCEQAELLANDDDPARHQDAIRELRRQWKAIGLVPKNKARRLWNRFRRACNRVMSEAKKAAEEAAPAEEATPAEKATSVEETAPAEEATPAEEAAPAEEPTVDAGPADTATAAAGEGQATAADEGQATAADEDKKEGAATVAGGWDEALDSEWDVVLDESEESIAKAVQRYTEEG
jgi:hypothetical protein